MKAYKRLSPFLVIGLMSLAFVVTSLSRVALSVPGRSAQLKLFLTQADIALPCIVSAAIGVICLFACGGSATMRQTAAGVLAASLAGTAIATVRQVQILTASSIASSSRLQLSSVDPGAVLGVAALLLSAGFSLRVMRLGRAAFRDRQPKRISGRRAIYGDATWMTDADARVLFPEDGGMVIGERYRVDRGDVSNRPFRSAVSDTWGLGGKAPLLCFDCSFGSTHGIVFAGSGGFKTTSVTVPTALKWGGPLILLDPSNEVAPMVGRHRMAAGRQIHSLDPQKPQCGFNALDWIGKFSSSKEEDIVAVASWILTDSGRVGGLRDDFFRTSALQLVTAIIADICLSGQTDERDQTLRQARAHLSEPEPRLRKRLKHIYELSPSAFVRENVAVFVDMAAQTFSGVHANAIKETHWLSYPHYAALVSGSSFSTQDIGSGAFDVFINIDLTVLDNHPGLARVIIGSLLAAMYNRDGALDGRALFLLDEVARLGYMRILETARDAGRKYGITLAMIYQSIGQLRETYGGRDASSKWFESASWISFAAINDPETAQYISSRCGTTTVEIDQVTKSQQSNGSSRTRAKQLVARPLIEAYEVLQMRSDEQIVFTAGRPPLRCGRAIWFRRADMRRCVEANRFRDTA